MISGLKRSWRPILCVFLPFVAAYYLSFFFRTINATIADDLTAEFGLGAGALGVLTAAYYLTFAAAQLPIGVLLDKYGPGRVQGVVMISAALGAALFSVAESFWALFVGRGLIGLGVAASLTAGLKALAVWFPSERVPLLNGLMVMLGGLGAAAATLPAEPVLTTIGWRGLFELLAIASAGCSLLVFFLVPRSSVNRPAGGLTAGLTTVYRDRRFWRLAPLTAMCIGSAWALQGLWAGPWLRDIESLDREAVLLHLLIMALSLSTGALLWGIAVDRLRRLGIRSRTLLVGVAMASCLAQLALILRLPLPIYIPWIFIALTGAATVLSYATLADYFPKELAGRANAALNLFHIGGAFAVQTMTGLVLQLWDPADGRYALHAYQAAFACNVGLQVLATVWFASDNWALRMDRSGLLRYEKLRRFSDRAA